jgi:hypothetical protein
VRAQDGLTVPFALTAGLSSLGSSRTVVLGGVAELLAGALSMGLGGFLAAQAERDATRHTRRALAAHVGRSCAAETAREVLALLGPLGVSARVAGDVAADLARAEDPAGDAGASAFLLRFGEGMEEVPDRRMCAPSRLPSGA